MQTVLKIKVFVSSPSDVKEERKIVLQIAEELNRTSGRRKGYYIHCYEWELDLQSGWGNFQDKINPELEDTDIFIGILWTRLGTPTKKYKSGTIEEFERIKQLKNKGRGIEFAFFRSNKNPRLSMIDPKQFARVKKFFAENNGNVFTIKDYQNNKEFKKSLREHLEIKIDKLLESKSEKQSVVNEASLKENGVLKIYTPELNDVRNKDKKDFLSQEEGELYLLAHTGNAYFNKGASLYGTLEDNIKKYNKFKIILLNPYSLEARKIYFAENFDIHNNEITNINIKGGLDSGENMKRFLNCLEGIERLKEKNSNIEVRISNVATDGTILMSKNKLFFEPYLCARFLKRINRGLNIFEFQVENIVNKECGDVFSNQGKCKECSENIKELCSKNLYKTISEQFFILWEISVPLNEYLEQENKYKETFLNDHNELFKNEVFQLHDSWFAFDPIIGCKNNCSYCFLGTRGWRNTKPTMRIISNSTKTISELIQIEYKTIINNYLYKTSDNNRLDQLGIPPISIGNKTDILQEINRECLDSFLKTHNKSGKKTPVVLITKEIISLKFLNEAKNFNFDIYLFISLSYLPNKFEPNVNHYTQRLNTLKEIRKIIDSEKISNIKLVHYWRPMTDLSENKNYTEILNDAKDIFHCTIGIGLKVFQKLYNYFKTDYPELQTYVDNKHITYNSEEEEILPSFDEDANKYAHKIEHPFFKHTSCAISYLQKKADFNGSMWRENFCDYCEKDQKKICFEFKENHINLFEKIKGTLEYLTNATICDNKDYIEVLDKALTQEEITLYTHIVGKPVYSKSVRFSLVWESSNQKYLKRKYANN
jgi:DNA repair photolyase